MSRSTPMYHKRLGLSSLVSSQLGRRFNHFELKVNSREGQQFCFAIYVTFDRKVDMFWVDELLYTQQPKEVDDICRSWFLVLFLFSRQESYLVVLAGLRLTDAPASAETKCICHHILCFQLWTHTHTLIHI